LVFGSLKTAFERLVLDSAGDDQASKAEKWGGQEGYREAEPRCDIGVSGRICRGRMINSPSAHFRVDRALAPLVSGEGDGRVESPSRWIVRIPNKEESHILVFDLADDHPGAAASDAEDQHKGVKGYSFSWILHWYIIGSQPQRLEHAYNVWRSQLDLFRSLPDVFAVDGLVELHKVSALRDDPL
jgi:hypothetical protein